MPILNTEKKIFYISFIVCCLVLNFLPPIISYYLIGKDANRFVEENTISESDSNHASIPTEVKQPLTELHNTALSEGTKHAVGAVTSFISIIIGYTLRLLLSILMAVLITLGYNCYLYGVQDLADFVSIVVDTIKDIIRL